MEDSESTPIKELIKESLRLEVATTSEYVGDMAGGDSLYKDFHTIKLLLDGEVISEIKL